MSSYGARRLAAREGEVLKEPALRRYQLVDGAMLTWDRSVRVRVRSLGAATLTWGPRSPTPTTTPTPTLALTLTLTRYAV